MTRTAETVLNAAGLHDSHWGERIIDAERRGHFDRDAGIQAFNWQTCACGSQDERIPRYGSGEPKDVVLFVLGEKFCECVQENNFESAARVLVDIEHRAAEILQGLNES